MSATVYTLPAALQAAAGFSFGYQNTVIVSPSPHTGRARTLEIPGWRWVAELYYSTLTADESGELKALLVKLRGGANRLSLFEFGNPVPRGTLRGSPVLAAPIAYGDESMSVTCGSGMTIRKGDMLGLTSGQLVMALDDATAAPTTLTVPFGPPARAAVAGGQAVTWNQPTANFVPLDNEIKWSIDSANRVQDVRLTFMEIY